MNPSSIKDAEQAKAINHWIGNNCRGTLELCTGFGKTLTALKAGLFFISKMPNFRILILTPTEVIRDTVWREEAKNWNMLKEYERNFHAECIQTAYQWENTHWDLVIADEVHNYLSPEYRKFWQNNKFDRVLGLSAKIPYESLAVLNTVAPIIYRMTIQEAKKQGIISNYLVCNIPVDFTPAESVAFRKIQNAYTFYERSLGGPAVAYKNAEKYRLEGDVTQKKNANAFFVQMQRRARFLYTAQNKYRVVNQILDMFPMKTAIVFTQSKEVAFALSEERTDTVHYYAPDSKDKEKGYYLSKDDRKHNLDLFNDPTSGKRIMAAVKALNEGANVPRVSLGILHSGTQSQKDFIQRVGRTVRAESEDKLALIINLYVKGTQEEKWLNNRLGSFVEDAKWIDNISDLRTLQM